MKFRNRSRHILTVAAPAVLLSSVFAHSSVAGDFGFLPYGWLNMDIATKLINQGEGASATTSGSSVQLVPADEKAGYRQVKTKSIDLIGGVYGGWYLNDGTFASTLFGAGAAILPVAGGTMISDRYAPCLKDAEAMSELKIPAHAEGLADWKAHDNVFYDTKGGVVFSIGVGYVMSGLSGDYLVQGDWTTYVEKIDGNKVFVKISSVHMNDFDGMAGTQPAYAMMSKFLKDDHYLSYTFDVSDARAARAYEAMIHGSVKEAQELESSHPELASQDQEEQGHTKGHQTKLFLGLPFLNRSKTWGSLYNFSNTVTHSDMSKSAVEYGLYWNQSASDVGSHHHSVSTTFYGVAFQTSPSAKVALPQSIMTGKYGKMNISYEDDHSTQKTLREDLEKILAQTGMHVQMNCAVKDDQLGYTHLSLAVELPEAATHHLMRQGANGELQKMAQSELKVEDQDFGESMSAVADMQSSLVQMLEADAKHDDVSFVKAYSTFGKAMLKNPQTFKMVLRATEGDGVNVDLQAEGTKLSKVSQPLQASGTNDVFLF
jgi:hypothetical protein